MSKPPTASQFRKEAIPFAIAYPDDLPITAWREDLLDAIDQHQVVIVAGETGSGKSTQLPKLCLELGRGVAGRIGHTQPRRIAARSIAERVAQELETQVGELVGYTVRFTDEVSDSTAIKVMTDGILLNEIRRDPKLARYDTIIIDEAHERTLNIDFLVGYLKNLLPRRPDLKLIITSATIDTTRFAEHFDDAPVVEVEGRMHDVEVRYRPLVEPGNPEPRDQSQAICDAVQELATEGTGDVLVFCSGEREIRDAVDALANLELRHTEILPLFGRLSASEQHKVFSGHTGRRIVVATNVAETSLTVPGIRYVVDAGMARVSRYNRRTKVQQLPIEAVSQASAEQRAGRCGRLGPGICIRLYDQDDFDGRPEFTDPEILRTSLASVMLQMASVGLGSMDDFPFIDTPDRRSIRDAVALLWELDAVGDGFPGERSWLTDIGRRLARIPIDPRYGRMLIAADENACLDEALTIVSALSILDPRERPQDKEEQADQKHRRYADESSDFLSWLHLWKYITDQRHAMTSNQFRRMCRKDFLNWRRVREWQDLRAQLRRVTRDMRMHPNPKPATPELIHESLLAGLLSHVGKKDPDSWEYRGAQGARFSIRPGSALFKKAPEWVMAAELIETTRTWASGVAYVDPDMIERVGDHLVRRTLSDPWWDADIGAAAAHETVTLLGLPLTSDRTVLYERFDPAVARELFIRGALVEADWESDHSFAVHNTDQIEAVLEIETRERRADLLVPDDAIVAWFDARIPADITSATAFDAWWRREREKDPRLLELSRTDLIDPGARAPDEEAFPRSWHYGDLDLPLTYEFDTTSPYDGVTVDVPLASLDRIDPGVFEWNVPGFREDLITSLIKALPKQQRKQFAPAAETARTISPEIAETEGHLIESLARILTRRGKVIIRPDDFDLERVPTHLKPWFRVIDERDTVVAEGEDLSAVVDQMRDRARETVAASTHALERTGITSWDFGDLPRVVSVGDIEHTADAYPALVDAGASVSIRLMATSGDQAEASWQGLRRLVLLELPSPRRLLRDVLASRGPVHTAGSPYEDSTEWMEDCMRCAVDAVLAESGGLVWSQSDYDTMMRTMRSDLGETLESIGVDAADVLESLHLLDAAMDTTPDVFSDVLEDIDEQIDRFIFPDFISAVGANRLSDVKRYLDAATYRLEKLRENPDRDRANMQTVRQLGGELDNLTEVLSASQELVETAWMLQELRVSLFAQPIGTKGSISEKRVRRALEDLLR